MLHLQHDLYICLCYVVPDESSRQSMIETNIFDRLLDSVAFLENNTQNSCHLLVCGDFNSRTSTQPDFVVNDDPVHMSVLPDDYTPDMQLPRFSEDKGQVNNNGLLLLDMCKQTGLRIMNGRVGGDTGIGHYTFVGSRGSSVVDYVIASQELFKFVKHFEVQEPNILSDHCLINFSFQFHEERELNTQSEDYERFSGKYIWSENFKENFTGILSQNETTKKLETLNLKIANCRENEGISTCISEFTNLIENIASPIFKRTNYRNNDKSAEKVNFSDVKENPWFDEKCNEKKHVFSFMLNKYRDSKSDTDRINMVKARSEYKSMIRKCRYEYDKEKTSRFINAKFKDAKLYWNMLKETAGIKSANIPLSSFERYFKAINNPSDPFYTPDEDVIFFNDRYEKNEFSIMFDGLNVNFSQEEILKAIHQLKTNKSAGPDKLINEFFIHGKAVLVPTLVTLFNKLFENEYFPEEWSEGYVIPLHKKGSINDVENYRGITLLSALGKLFSRVINNRLAKWADNYFILIEAQAGFRSEMSTVDNIFVLHGLISHILNQGKKLYCAFIDFTKAFDYVVRDNLWYKLIKLGLRGRILNIVKSMYATVKSKIKFCNKIGNEFFCSLGVRQGECLSPLLFSLYLNDIEEQFIQSGLEGLDINMFKVFMLLYADDIVIFSKTAEELQSGLDLLSEYCQRWKLSINVSKSKVLVFRKGGMLPRDMTFIYEGAPLEIVKSFKYLGVVFTSGGSFAEAQNTLAGQAQKAIFKLNKYLYKFTFISTKHKLDLFDKLVMPIMNYACEVWGFFQANSIERVHLQFCKRLLGVKKSTQNDFVYGELGRTNCLTKRYLVIIKYWFKLLFSQENKYIKLVYNLMLSDLEILPDKVNWASLVRHLLLSLGFYEVWLNQGVGDYAKFISLCRQRLNDTFIQNWRARLENSTRALFYNRIAVFQFQPYLEKVNVLKFSQAFSRLRMSSHRLEIEAGRWVKPNSTPLNERICTFCKVLEDEYHFILECSVYKELRQKYITRYYWRGPSMFKFIELINSDNATRVRKLCIFIFEAFKIRSDLLYGGRS